MTFLNIQIDQKNFDQLCEWGWGRYKEAQCKDIEAKHSLVDIPFFCSWFTTTQQCTTSKSIVKFIYFWQVIWADGRERVIYKGVFVIANAPFQLQIEVKSDCVWYFCVVLYSRKNSVVWIFLISLLRVWIIMTLTTVATHTVIVLFLCMCDESKFTRRASQAYCTLSWILLEIKTLL